LRLVFGGVRIQFSRMMKAFLPLILLMAFSAGMSRATDDVTEKSDVLVPDGMFGSMRKVDSETLILPDAAAVVREQQQRTAAQESRARAAQRAEAERPTNNADPVQTTAPAAMVEPSPEAALVEESAQAAAVIEEPSTTVAEPAPANPVPEPEPPSEPEPTPAEEATEP
jgi:cell division protein FtsN